MAIIILILLLPVILPLLGVVLPLILCVVTLPLQLLGLMQEEAKAVAAEVVKE